MVEFTRVANRYLVEHVQFLTAATVLDCPDVFLFGHAGNDHIIAVLVLQQVGNLGADGLAVRGHCHNVFVESTPYKDVHVCICM